MVRLWGRLVEYIFLISFLCLQTLADPPTGIVQITRRANAKGSLFASGILVGNKIYTCYHCVAGELVNLVATGIGKLPLEGTEVDFHPSSDLAIITLKRTYRTDFEVATSPDGLKRLSGLPWERRSFFAFRNGDEPTQTSDFRGYTEGRASLVFDNPGGKIGQGESGGGFAIREGGKYVVIAVLSKAHVWETFQRIKAEDSIEFIPFAWNEDWVVAPRAKNRMTQLDVQEATRRYLLQNSYDVSPLGNWVMTFSHWEQFLAVKSLVDDYQPVLPCIESISKFSSPYQTRLLSYASSVNMPDLDKIAEQLTAITTREAYEKFLKIWNEWKWGVQSNRHLWSHGYFSIARDIRRECEAELPKLASE